MKPKGSTSPMVKRPHLMFSVRDDELAFQDHRYNLPR